LINRTVLKFGLKNIRKTEKYYKNKKIEKY
jgi:hypothetical protein